LSPVPYLDLSRARQRIAPVLAERWQRILDANAFVLGPEVKEFECAFCGLLEATGVVAVANGTDALVVALRALGLAGPATR
jgi:dTDP-4-amino-4,6-dideoxygalactose transaminase